MDEDYEPSQVAAELMRRIEELLQLSKWSELEGDDREHLGNALIRLGRSLLPPAMIYTGLPAERSLVEIRLAQNRARLEARVRERDLEYGPIVDAMSDEDLIEFVDELGLIDTFRRFGRKRSMPIMRPLISDLLYKRSSL